MNGYFSSIFIAGEFNLGRTETKFDIWYFHFVWKLNNRHSLKKRERVIIDEPQDEDIPWGEFDEYEVVTADLHIRKKRKLK